MSSLHERAGEVFLAALSRPAAERDSFLVEACRGDDALLREVGSLLLFHEGGDQSEACPVAQRQDFSAGEVFAGRYRMIARVGRGGMGDVWRADDLILDAPVALKLMHSASPSDRSRILQEVRAFTASDRLDDDQTLLAIRYTGAAEAMSLRAA